MGNSQIQPGKITQKHNISGLIDVKPMDKVKFIYVDPIKPDNEGIPEDFSKEKQNLKTSQHMKRSQQPTSKNEQQAIKRKTGNQLNRYSLTINMNRSLDQFHKKFQSIKVKWNQFIKIKKKNFFTDYEVVYQIGQGNYGNVYKVRGIHTGIFRAAKKIYKNKLTQDLHSKLFQEIAIMMNLDHPNINKILQVYEHADYYVILMELCEGGQLFNKIVAKSLSENSAAIIIKQILRALIYIHSKNIVHRDIKPENMLFEKGSNLIKIIDFGIATVKKTQKLNERLGTPYYIAPEVLYKSYDEKCDVWSCGVILYMIIFGCPPFSGADELQIMKNVLNEPLKFQGPQWREMSPLGKDFLKGLLQKDPASRFSTQQAFNHPWLSNVEEVYSQDLDYDYLKSLCRFHFKNKLEAVVLTYVVSQVLSSTDKLPLLKSFIEADKNSDGVLSFDQIKDLIKSKNPELFKSLKVQTIDKLLRSLDLNNSGQIDYTEFLVATIRKSTITRQHLQTAFSYFDIDHNGAITFSQIIQFLQNSNESLCALKKMFQKFDANHDGQISKEEFFKLTLNV